ncbi:glycoside hydrolase family 70 protein [Leuconostoc citreum]|uniref:glycoside hydrolase family 70 protein n=1 Tax=Leuconostoc citreum TaxID=33964 RepID=UPI0021A37D98|nr:glycoside hydrolase family 70 protein [Leuconostoc citreum]MCT3057579.1 alternansucrase [Leuconostoc citreum]MCT3060190.1 alternansucrase [Leuconostoc citreum]
MKQQETVTRKKLYKSGKVWVAAATAFAVLGVSTVTTVHADTNSNVAVKQINNTGTNDSGEKKVPVPSTNNDSLKQGTDGFWYDSDGNRVDQKTNQILLTAEQLKKNNEKNLSVISDDTSKKDDENISKQTKIANQQTVDTAKGLTTSNLSDPITGGHYENHNGYFVYIDASGKQVTGLQNIDGNLQYFDDNGYQVKGSFRDVNGKHIYFDSVTGKASSNVDIVNGKAQGYDAQGNQLKKSYVADSSGQIYYFDGNGQPLIGLQTIDGNLQYFNQQGVQIKGGFQDVNNKRIYFAPNTGNAVANTEIINGKLQGRDANGNQVKNAFSKDVAGNTFYFDANGVMLTGLQTISGKTYYLDEQGHLRKNYAGTFNNQFMYFDADTGAGKTAIEYQFDQGLVSQSNENTPHNAAKSYDKSSFENVDGYLTADTWYRPTDILKNGDTWTASTETDMRPLLMTWWPDKQTQANYLNFMSSKGLGITTTYTAATSQKTLNDAAFVIQTAIEQQISLKKSTEWLRDAIDSFVKTQANWNKQTEDEAFDGLQWLQGGFLAYQDDSHRTPNTDSGNNRKLGRQPINIDGSKDTTDGKGSEFLLANDIDNSNPIVQAEQLNWLHYLMNFGSITGNNDNANFDGIRVDAVDNVDADLLKIAGDYFKALYGTDKSDANANKHLSILEDWNGKDPQYVNQQGNAQLTMDYTVTSQFGNSLTHGANNRSNMWYFLDTGYYLNGDLNKKIVDKNRPNSGTLVNRIANSGDTKVIPNYSFVRAHDYDAQDPIRKAMIDHGIIKNMQDTFTFDQLAQGMEFYYKDQENPSGFKKYNDYNLPSAYAMLLTNKDTVPRVYYGDMYLEGGQYMEKGTIYNPVISALLKARIKYVSGGQTMATDSSGKDLKDGETDLLTSVRFGKGIMTSDQTTTQDNSQDYKNQGIGVIVGNNPDLKLNNDKTITLHMGKAHKNQLYRALVLSNDSGIDVYDSDDKAPTLRTNDNGDLIFHKTNTFVKQDGTIINYEMKGSLNALISGYLGVWVPVGASDSQDARTVATESSSSNDGSVFHSNAALDSNVIYEGFSNFQAMPTSPEQSTNVVIATKANLFKELGITSFELAPQYRSSGDTNYGGMSFLDSFLNNGYAFTDRYDLGFNKADGNPNPTKYGTDQDLRNAIEALHKNGMQAIADWVPDQIYALPGKEVVTATRVDERGNQLKDTDFVNLLYVANTKSSGVDYQAKYGGEFLDKLREEYPSLFKQNQVSTGQPIDASTKIKQWSAKYMNGTNILHRGAYYVLKDWATNQYFNIAKTNEVFLPLQLQNKDAQTGFISDASGVKYYSISGYQAKDTFIEDGNGNWYYFDKDGYMVRSQQGENPIRTVETSVNTRNGNYYFMPNGVELRKGFGTDNSGNVYYFDDQGKMVRDKYINDDANNFYHLNVDGTMSRGLFKFDSDTLQYFASNGVQIKDSYAKDSKGNKYYFDSATGNNDTGKAQTWDGNGYYITIDSDANNTIGVNTDYTAYITSSLREDGLFANAPYGVVTKDQNGNDLKWQYINHTKQYEGQQVQVTRQYTDSKGVSWNLITFAGGDLQGQKLWVDSRALTMTPFKTMNQISFISYANRNDGLFLNAPYQVKGYQLAGMSNQYKGQQVTIAGVANVSGKDWSLISFNGTQYWIDSQALNTNFTHDMNQKVFVNTTSNLDGLFLNAPYRQPGYKLAGLAKNYNNQTVTVSQQYFDDQGTVWSQVVLGGQTVWVDNHALAQMQVSDTDQQLYVNSNGRNDGLFLNAPYRGQGSQLIGMTADYNGQHVQVTKQGQDAYGAQWRLITLNNQQVWVDSRALSTTIMQAMNDNMYVNSSQRTDGLWLNAPYTMSGAKWAGDTRSANGRYVHISKAYSNEVGNTYYLTNLNGQSTWIDKRAFTVTFDQVVALNATIVARQRPDGMFKTAPYGEAGAQFVDYVTNYNQQTVPVTKQHSDAQGNQWYLATVNGTQYWIDQRSFSPVVTKVVDYQAKIVPRTTRDGVFSGAPYGEVNAKLVNMATAYQNQVVHATGEYTNASGITWSQFALSGQEDKLWIDKRALQA